MYTLREIEDAVTYYEGFKQAGDPPASAMAVALSQLEEDRASQKSEDKVRKIRKWYDSIRRNIPLRVD